ncbi:hypothetical protein O9165_02170, partial [Treponema pallidum]
PEFRARQSATAIASKHGSSSVTVQ